MLATYLVDRVTIPRNFMSRLVVGADSYVGEACAKRVRKEFILVFQFLQVVVEKLPQSNIITSYNS